MRIATNEKGDTFAELVTLVDPVTQFFDNTPNENSKIITIPEGEKWVFRWAYVHYVATNTLGSRLLKWEVSDSDSNVVFCMSSAVTQSLGQTREYIFAPGIERETAFSNDVAINPIPNNFNLLGGWQIKVFDSADIDTNDDMTLSVQANVYKGA